MKASYFRTPRTMSECQFQTGYRPALPRDRVAEIGHVVLNAACIAGLLVVVPLLLLGVL